MEKKNIRKQNVKRNNNNIFNKTWEEYRSQSSTWKFIALSSAGINFLLAITIFVYLSSTKYFILDKSGRPVEISESDKLPFTQDRIIAFADEAISQIYSLNYRFISEQIKNSKTYMSDASYKKLLKEVETSNYINKIKENKAIMTVIPTNLVYKTKMINQDTLEIVRSYNREDISKNVKNYQNVFYKITIKRVIPTGEHPWGLVITDIIEEDKNQFLKQIN